MPLVLVVCEGVATEPQYINGFRLAHGANTVRVQIEAPGGDPLSLVKRAISLQEQASRAAAREHDENLMYDEVWCVFDVDEHARLKEAREVADERGIQLAVSNPCFELWMLLHFTDHGAHLTSKRAAELVRKHLPRYEKHVRYEDLSGGYADAVQRAHALERRHAEAGTDCGNPSTGMHRLTERIRESGRSQRL